eukprot:6144372-Amphidinium_carterae.2
MQSTSKGTLEWHTSMSELNRVWHGEMWNTFGSAAFALQSGLSTTDVTSPPPLKGIVSHQVLDAIYMYALRLVGIDVIWQENYYGAPPAMFCGLLSENGGGRAGAGDRIRRLWMATLALEERGHTDRGVQTFLDTLVWRRASWVRDLFISFEETDFAHLPADTRDEIACGYMRSGTKVIEDFAYDTTSNSTRIRDDDLSPVPALPTDDVNRAVLVDGLFDPRCNDYSLGDSSETWSELFDATTYAHPGPEAFMEQSLATSALLALADGDTSAFNFSKLAPLGWLLKHQDASWDDSLLVAATSEHGLVGLSVRHYCLGGCWFVTPLSECPSPTMGASNGSPEVRLDRVRLELSLHPWSLLSAAALTCWRGITVTELQQFARQLHWTGVGRTEAEVIRNMTRWALPDFPESGPEIRWLVSQRLGDGSAASR